MHIIVTVHKQQTEPVLADLALQAGIRVYSLQDYKSGHATGSPSFLLGFGGLSEHQIERGIEKLMNVWGIQKAEQR